MADSDILGTQEVLCQELDEIERRRGRRIGASITLSHDDLETHRQRAQRLQLSALCLSGGGIRSAAFCLGVLQALATKRMLRQFDYLSTVSGGGFVGGWLQVLIGQSGGVSGAEDAIAQPRPDALRRLRAYTNYLTPQTGPLSTDTWAGIVLYLRNLLINWTIFAPLFLLLALVPIVYRTAIWVCSDFVWVNLTLLACASVTLLIGVIQACGLIPSHRQPRSASDPTPSYASAGCIQWGIVYPALGWTLLIPWLLDFANGTQSLTTPGSRICPSDHSGPLPRPDDRRFSPGLVVAETARGSRHPVVPGEFLAVDPGQHGRCAADLVDAEHRRLDPAAGIAAGIDTATVLTVFAPLALSVVHVLQTSLYVALRRETELADLDREWLGGSTR